MTRRICRRIFRRIFHSVGSALLALAASTAVAQTYPAKPIKLIVPFPPGGATDIVGRLMAQKLSEGLGQQVFVENRAGAAGTIGAEAAAKSPADGYTIFFGTTGTLSSAPALQRNLAYDPIKSFAPISILTNAPVVVVVNSAVPAKSLQELIELAKSRPGKLTYGSAGVGHFLHVAGEAFKAAAGVDLFHVPYKGAGPALIDLVGGRIDVMIDTIVPYTPHVQSGKLRALAVAHSRRLSRLPDLPTAAEAGLPGYEFSAWFGLLAPAGTSNEIVRRLNSEVLKAMATQEVLDTLAKLGLEPSGSSPDQYSALIVAEGAKWSRLVKTAGIKLE